MVSSKINWCLKQRRGIELIETNENLMDGYFNKAENSIIVNNKSFLDSKKLIFLEYSLHKS